MTTLQAFFLGLLQGIAEFLPVSSSGHLKLAQELFGLTDVPLMFDVFLHIATLLAVCIYFRKIILRLFTILFRVIFRREEQPYTGDDPKILSLAPDYAAGMNTIFMIIISTIVTGVMGIAVKKFLDSDSISVKFICAGFLVTSVLLLLSGLVSGKQAQVTGYTKLKWYQAVAVGFAQGIGTLPGISRSGSTISGAVFCGVGRVKAGDYSFIISIPAILGAFVLTLKDFFEAEAAVVIETLPLAVSFVTAFVSGYAALSLLMKLINRGKLAWFAVYLIPLGIFGLIYF